MHSLNGQIHISVSGQNDTKFIGLPNTIFNQDKVNSKVITPNVSANSKAIKTDVDEGTENYFNQAVRKALKAKDVNKALNLVNEAEKLGLTTPRQIFLKNVNFN